MASLRFHIPGFRVQSAHHNAHQLVIIASSKSKRAVCPDCRKSSRRVHAYYTRKPKDLPVTGMPALLVLRVRRFKCLFTSCERKTFSEPLVDFLPHRARRTTRLTEALRHIGFALSGAAGARLAVKLGMPVSGNTLIRILLATPRPHGDDPEIIGVDDWAWRRGHHYGTILVDLERRRPLDLLPDRKADSLAAALKGYPSATLLTRDRSTEYASGMRMGLPGALQIADRWHLVRNVRDMTIRLHARLRKLQYVAPHNGGRRFTRSSGQEKERQERKRRYERRKEMAIHLHAKGLSTRQIAKLLRMGRQTIGRYVNGEHASGRTPRTSIIDPYVAYLESRWREGCHNAAQLWREIKEQGFPGSDRQVTRWARTQRLRSASDEPLLPRGRINEHNELPQTPPLELPDKRTFGWLFICPPKQLSNEHRQIVSTLCRHETVKHCYELVQELLKMIRREEPEDFLAWYKKASQSEVGTIRRFANHLYSDRKAVMAAMTYPWSNGQVEGQINKLKLIKRQMYGRAGLPLLRQRLLHQSK